MMKANSGEGEIKVRTTWVGVSILAWLLSWDATAAIPIDLTGANPGLIDVNGGLWYQGQLNSGSGQYVDLVGPQATGTEEGYNTSAKKTAYDETGLGPFGIWLADLSISTFSGTTYYAFTLDVNENDEGISVDEFNIYIKYPENDLVGGKPAYGGLPLGDGSDASVALGKYVYQLNRDGTSDDNVVLAPDLKNGSGKSDIAVLLPTSFFDAALVGLGGATAANTAVYLYSKMGAYGTTDPIYDATAGPEQWANNAVTVVPEPRFWALGTGMALLAFLGGRRLRGRSSN
jgi:hypothetical protein